MQEIETHCNSDKNISANVLNIRQIQRAAATIDTMRLAVDEKFLCEKVSFGILLIALNECRH